MSSRWKEKSISISDDSVVALEGEVYLHLRRQFHQLRLHLLTVGGFTTQGELDAGTSVLRGVLDTLTAREAQDAVDVQSLVCKDARGTLYLTGLQLTAHHHEDVTVLALMSHPVFILIVANG